MRAAWSLTDAELAEQRLQLLAGELGRSWPDAAASLREGMAETLTLMRLGITGRLAKTLCSTNPCESMIEIVLCTQRNIKRWQGGDMRKRWTAAGMLVAEQQFRRIIGYRDLATLVIAVERHALRNAPALVGDHKVAKPVTV
jgi:hypothetical protein